MEDATTEDATRTIERAMNAIIGAVYFDSGFEAARRAMAHLGLTIKVGNELDQRALIDVGFSEGGVQPYRDDDGDDHSGKPLLL